MKRRVWYPLSLGMALILCRAEGAEPPTQAVSVSPVGQEFVAAMQRVRQHAPDVGDSPALQEYLLYDYLAAARLRRDLAADPNEALDMRIDMFLHAHAAQPVARGLRHDWLASLADRQKWDWFLPRAVEATDPQLVCERLVGRLATGDTEGLGADALARWSIAQKQPAECNVVFAWLRSRELITPELAEARTRAALMAENSRLAHEFILDVPRADAGPLMQWLQMLDSPKAAVAAVTLAPTAPVEPEALVAGFGRLSFTDTAAASSLLPSLLLRPDMTPTLKGRLQRAVALGAAYGRASTAIAAFASLPAEINDTQVQEWRVRAALWAGDFAKVNAGIEQMTPSVASQPRWRYWHARAVAATSGAAAAAPLYADVANLRDYYGYLAADRLGQPYHLNIHPSPDDVEAQTTLAAEPGMARAHALFDCDMVDEATGEWATVLTGAKPALKVQAARLASLWGWYAQTIATLAQTGEWDDVPLRYPRPYASIVAQAATETGVPTDWLYGVMRQESLFRKDAVSHADARGLMQILPATAMAVARRSNLPAPDRDTLFDPAVAVKLGALYVRELLDRYKGRLDQTLAAYNAGPLSVTRWRPGRPMDADIWIENIPYTETRGYIQHIVEHIVAFATMRNAEPPRLSTLLPPLDPAAPL